MPNNWKKYKLDELLISKNQGVNTTTEKVKYSESGIPVIRAKNISESGLDMNDVVFVNNETYSRIRKECKPKRSDLLYTNIGSQMGNAVVVNHESEFTIAWNVLRMVCNEKLVDNYFLMYSLNENVKKTFIRNLNTSSTMPFVSGSVIGGLEFLLPPLKEQQAIAEILSALDDKIELNLQTNKTLEEMANALYKHWFVDFGPFLPPGRCLKDGGGPIPGFVESELGLIPEGWEVKNLGQLLSIKHGYAFKGNHFTSENTGKIVLTPGNFEKTGGIKFNSGKEKFYNADYPKEYELKLGQVIIALTDLTPGCEILGSAAIIIDEDQIYLHNQRLGLVQLVDDKFGINLFFQIFNSAKFREFIKASRTGSTVSHTAPTRIYDFEVALPKYDVLKELEKNLENFRTNINHNICENKVLVRTRDYLLPKLISGEIRVKSDPLRPVDTSPRGGSISTKELI